MANLVQTVVAAYGILRAGAVAVLNNPLYTNRELEHQYNDSGFQYLFSLDVLVPRMIDLTKKTGIRKIISCYIRDFLPFPLNQLFPFVKKGIPLKTLAAKDVFEFMDLIKKHQPISNPPKLEWEGPAALVYMVEQLAYQKVLR